MAFSHVRRWDPSPWCVLVPPCGCNLVLLVPHGAGGMVGGMCMVEPVARFLLSLFAPGKRT